jgi:hypothetical protein
MSRFYLRIILVPVLFFTVVLLLMRARPYDVHEMRQALLPEACHMPCFMGIRPGVTTMREVPGILQLSGWVAGYDITTNSGRINITWNDERPAWLVNNGINAVIGSNDQMVSQIGLQTNIMLGDIHMSLGEPPVQYISLDTFEGHTFLFYSATYPKEGIGITVSRDCDEKKGSINYRDKVIVGYVQLDAGIDFPPAYHRSWLEVARTACH